MAAIPVNTAQDFIYITGTTSGTITAMPIDTAAADRLVFMHFNNLDGNSAAAWITGLTIDGVTANKVAGAEWQDSGNGVQSVIFWALVPTHTTGNVVITLANSSGDNYIQYAAFAVTGANTTTPVTSSNKAADLGGAPSAAVTVGSGGALLAGSSGYFFGASSFASWTNATASPASAQEHVIGGVREGEATATGTSVGSTTVTATWGGTSISADGPLLSLVAIDAAAATGPIPYNPWPQRGPILAQ